MDIRHLRYSDFDRVRYSNELLAWLTVQATRLSVTTRQVYDALLAGYSSKEIEHFVGYPPVNTLPPVITGNPVVGQVLTMSDGTWDGAGITFVYAWLRDMVVIGGAVAKTYTLVAGDLGKTITGRVTATNSAGSFAEPTENSAGPIT
jgi:hypothetical protein